MSTPRVQILSATDGFILGRSRVGDALSLDTDTINWIDFLPETTSLEITRGGSGQGLSGLDVGTVSVQLKDDGVVPDPYYEDVTTTFSGSTIPINQRTERFTSSFTPYVADSVVGSYLRHGSGSGFFGQRQIALENRVEMTDGPTYKLQMTVKPSVDVTWAPWYYTHAGTQISPSPTGWLTGSFAISAGIETTITIEGPASHDMTVRLWFSNAVNNAQNFTLDIKDWSYTVQELVTPVPLQENLALRPNKPLRVAIPDYIEYNIFTALLDLMPQERFKQGIDNVGSGTEWETVGGALRLHAVNWSETQLYSWPIIELHPDEGRAFYGELTFTPSEDLRFRRRSIDPGYEYYLDDVLLEEEDLITGGVEHTISFDGVFTELSQVGPLLVHEDGDTFPFYIDVTNWYIDLARTVDGTLFTGTVQDIHSTESRESKTTYINLSAVDGVADLSATTRYGRYNAEDSATFEQAISALASSSGVPFESVSIPPVPIDLKANLWSRYGTAPSGTNPWDLYNDRTDLVVYTEGSGAVPARTWGIQTTVTGLTPGTTYQIEIGVESRIPDHQYALAVDGVWGVATTLKRNQQGTLRIEFEAVANTATLKLAPAIAWTGSAEFLVIRTAQMLGGNDRYLLQNVAYESSLTNHLSMTCDSVGAYWYVSKQGPVRFTTANAPQRKIYMLTDRIEDGDVSYTDVVMAWDTTNIINALDVNNHGRINTPGDDYGNTNDVTQTFTNPTSIATFGRRKADVDLSLRPEFLTERSEEILNRAASLERIPVSVTFDAAKAPDLAASLELTQRINISRKGEIYQARIRGIKHSAGPRKWFITLDLDTV